MTPSDLIRRLVMQADAIVTATNPAGRRAARLLMADLRAADALLASRLGRIASADSFTATQVAAYRAQIRAVVATVEPKLLGHTTRIARAASDFGARSAVSELTALENAFSAQLGRQAVVIAPIRLDLVTTKVENSLLRDRVSSVRRYGMSMVENFEREMRVGYLAGDTQRQIVERMVANGFVSKRSWAWRICRTESAHSMNAAKHEALRLQNEDEPDEPVLKKILATFDNRTAYDSKAVHGQVRKVDENFVDGLGRVYLYPPARPNDREVIIPWRKSWPDTGYMRPLRNPTAPVRRAGVRP